MKEEQVKGLAVNLGTSEILFSQHDTKLRCARDKEALGEALHSAYSQESEDAKVVFTILDKFDWCPGDYGNVSGYFKRAAISSIFTKERLDKDAPWSSAQALIKEGVCFG